MKKLIVVIFTTLNIFANALYSATWEDFRANADDAEFVLQSLFMDGGSFCYEFEYTDKTSKKPQSVFIIDTKRRTLKENSRNIFVDIGFIDKHFGDNGFELKDEADKEFLINFLLRFADHKEIHDTLKFLGKEVEAAPTKDYPKVTQERIIEGIRRKKMAKLEKGNKP